MNKRATDVLFLFPTADTNSGLGASFTHTLGIGYLRAFLRERGVDSMIFLSGATSLPRCVEEILSHRPRVVGISVMDDNYARSLLIANALKQANPALILVLGGPTPTVSFRYILENSPSIDVCVRGEGEEVFFQLLQALSEADFRMAKADLTGIPGISYRIGEALPVNEEAHILLKNKENAHYLDSYPSPYLTGCLPATEAEHSGIVTARGCNQSCVYCNCSILYKRHVFTHSIDRVLEELAFVGRMSPTKSANIFDDAFTLYPRRAENICRGLIENGIKLRLTCLTRCDYLTEDLLDLMKEAGFQTVSFSLESAVPRLLRVIGKNHPPEDVPSDNLDKEIQFIGNVKTMAAYAKKIGMNVFVSIILGLPTETHAESAETVRYLRELTFDQYNHNFLRILEGTPLSFDYEKYGYKLERVSKNQIRPRTIRPLDLSDMGRAENSMQENNFRRNEMEQFQILGVLTKRSETGLFFHHVILQSDTLDEKVVRWMQGNLALGGTILQIFSGPENFREKQDASLRMLLDHGSPSTKLVCYYRDGKENGGAEIWSRGKNFFCEETPIAVMGNKYALERYDAGCGSDGHVLALDREREDALYLGHFLQRFDNADSCFNHLMGSRPYPLFTGLCKWLSRDANCRKLETALIDEEGRIRLCWKGSPVGVLSDSAKDILRTLEMLRNAVMKERGCARCRVEETCIQCCFPDPLPAEEYCRFLKSHDVWEQAETFKTYYAFEEFFGVMNFEEATKEQPGFPDPDDLRSKQRKGEMP